MQDNERRENERQREMILCHSHRIGSIIHMQKADAEAAGSGAQSKSQMLKRSVAALKQKCVASLAGAYGAGSGYAGTGACVDVSTHWLGQLSRMIDKFFASSASV